MCSQPRLASLISLAVIFSHGASSAQDTVIELTNGQRLLVDQIGPTDNPSRLELTRRAPGIVIRRQVDRRSVADVRHRPSSPSDASLPARATARPVHLALEAAPDVRQPGTDWSVIRVRLAAYDEHGEPARLWGSLRLTLHGYDQDVQRVYQSQLNRTIGQRRQLAQWTRHLQPSVKPIELTLDLPRPLPDHTTGLYPIGQLHAELIMPGVSTLTTVQRVVPLKQVGGPFDTELQQTGSRFLPGETTSDSRRRSSHLLRLPSRYRPDHRVLSVQP